MVAADQPTAAAQVQANGTTGWELALVSAPSSNENATAASKLVISHVQLFWTYLNLMYLLRISL